jgi:DNA (cytosine-5)-methyltransferase 1
MVWASCYTVRVLDLFSGIGGFSLGLERAGMRTVAFCEASEPKRVCLAHHWPGVPIYADVRELTGARLAADGIGIDLICGGFPCQDISVAGKREGIEGERSGLWSEYARLIGEIRPRYVIVENVADLVVRGLGRVLGDLAALGFDAEWHCIPASAVGAPHERDRIWIVAYPDDRQRIGPEGTLCPWRDASGGRGEAVADADSDLAPQHRPDERVGWLTFAREIEDFGSAARAQWAVEPDVGRVANGVPARVDRLHALGDAVVPQIPEIIGRAILMSDECRGDSHK